MNPSCTHRCFAFLFPPTRLLHARSRQALKRGAGFEITSLPEDIPDQAVDSIELQRLSEAIERLATLEPRLAQVVDLKYFAGFSFGDIAAMWAVSERTVQRDWEKARLFLHRVLSAQDRGADLLEPSFVL